MPGGSRIGLAWANPIGLNDRARDGQGGEKARMGSGPWGTFTLTTNAPA